jgi:LCP family protein required for cell wall assembly
MAIETQPRDLQPLKTRQLRTPQPGSKRPPPAPNHQLALRITALYATFVLLAAMWGSWRIYGWARQRTLNDAESIYVQLASATNPLSDAEAQPNTEVVSVQPAADAAQSPPVTTLAPLDVLLLGSDERPHETNSANMDTLILLSLNPQTRRAGMLSFSRDLWVPVPGLENNAKINTIYGLGERNYSEHGGLGLVMDTIGSFIGRPVQYYVWVNFDGFVQIIDLIGGIDVVVPKTIHDEEYPTNDYGVETFHLEAGAQHLDGKTALKYARTRHVDSDYGRQRRQQDVLRAIFDKVRRPDMFPTLLRNLPSLIVTMRNTLQTNLPLSSQIAYATFVAQNNLEGIQQESIDGRYGSEGYNSLQQWILRPDRTAVRSAVRRYFGQINTADSIVVDTSWIRVEVLNGTSTPGVAARTRDLLHAQGWNIVSIGDADRSDYTQTLVVNYRAPDVVLKKINADLELQTDVNNLTGLAKDTPVDVRIVVGNDLLAQLQMAVAP